MAGLVLSGPERVTAPSVNSALLALSDGGFLTVWERLNPDGSRDALAQMLNSDGSSAGSSFIIASSEVGITMDGFTASLLNDGRFVIAWTRTTGLGNSVVQSRIFKANAAPESEVVSIGSGESFEGSPRIASLPNGSFAISYRDTVQLKSALFSSSGARLGDTDTLLNSNGSSAGMSATRNGEYVTVAAVLAETGGLDIVAYFQKPTGEVSEKLLAHVENQSSPPSVATLADGNVVVVWDDDVSAGNHLKARIFDASGTAVTAEISLYRNLEATVSKPCVKALPGGGFAVAFSQYDTQFDVLVGTYSATGEEVVAPTLVGQSAVGDQESPLISVLNDGRYSVSWTHSADAVMQTISQIYDPRESGVTWTGIDRSEQFIGTRFADLLKGSGGEDKLYGNSGNDIFDGGLGNDSLYGETGSDRLYGGVGNDKLYGGTESDLLSGQIGADILYGGTGNDKLYGGSENDTLLGEAGADLLYGEYGDDKLYGGTENDQLYGSAGNDQLKGDAGNDKLYGGIGKDVLYGGVGYDIFVFDTALNRTSNVDRILDYSVAHDTLWLDNRYMPKLGSGSAAKPVKLNAAYFAYDVAKDANDHLIYNRKSGVLSYDADGSGAGRAVEIAILKPGLGLTYHDVYIV